MSLPSPVQIKEANAHLVAVHRRVSELERRLDVAERTVREQAESLIRKDEQLRAALQEVSEAKEREIAYLHEKLCKSEETIQKFQSLVKEKDGLIQQLRHRSQLLDNICKSRPLLDNLLSFISEAERLGPVTGGMDLAMGRAILDELAESNCSPDRVPNHQDFSLSEDDLDDQDLDETMFGTTV
ncbi:vimentin-type intermediate filament-associated coiled-coil protein [Erpetoichthys calabaricus]|uniref:Vimentin type intermediate filament associated coiled-coil protein n=1 Tax=Erpetoichthys calabaricus TaxID=27687 RepID=A0A8C4SVR0_ERPCA|nr:vimentin-type intermediate filament-associated coiled-coil protein [Erpetoichthys calabaricus]